MVVVVVIIINSVLIQVMLHKNAAGYGHLTELGRAETATAVETNKSHVAIATSVQLYHNVIDCCYLGCDEAASRNPQHRLV